MGAMELRRLGMASKPVVVVPNHMLEQFSREWLQLYPQARVLAASSDDLKVSKTRDKRRNGIPPLAPRATPAMLACLLRLSGSIEIITGRSPATPTSWTQ